MLEQLSDSTLIVHQIYKRMWPSSQRDTVFLSHIREIPSYDAGDREVNEVGRPWIVMNYSIEHPDAPVGLLTVNTVILLSRLSCYGNASARLLLVLKGTSTKTTK